MAIGSKPSLVLAESSPLASSRLSLSSLSSVFQNNPLISYPAAALTNHLSSNLSCQIKKTLSSVDNENWTGAMRSAPLVDDLSLVNHFSREEYSKDEVETTYGLWQDDYPSALTVFDQMMKAAKGKQIAVFLDYDGTLSPIVEDPEKAFMSDAMRSVVKDVAKHFPTAIISGRSRDKVFNFVQLTEVYYAGSHGLDIMAPAKTSSTLRHTRSKDKKDNNAVIFQPASEFLPMMKEVFKLLQDKIKQIQGARVENNKFCVTVHFRCVEEKNWSALADIVRNVTKPFPRLHLNLGKKVLEIRPSIKWHKGDALEYLLEALGLGDKNEVIPLYIGDDRTDEDAFKALNARGQGYSILVSSVPRETNASYSLRNPTEVMSFLHHLVKWKKNFSRSRSMG